MNINITLQISPEVIEIVERAIDAISSLGRESRETFESTVKLSDLANNISEILTRDEEGKPEVSKVETETEKSKIEKEVSKQEEEVKPKISEVDLRAKFVELSKKGKREELKALLTDLGVAKVSDLTPDQYDETYSRLEAM